MLSTTTSRMEAGHALSRAVYPVAGLSIFAFSAGVVVVVIVALMISTTKVIAGTMSKSHCYLIRHHRGRHKGIGAATKNEVVSLARLGTRTAPFCPPPATGTL